MCCLIPIFIFYFFFILCSSSLFSRTVCAKCKKHIRHAQQVLAGSPSFHLSLSLAANFRETAYYIYYPQHCCGPPRNYTSSLGPQLYPPLYCIPFRGPQETPLFSDSFSWRFTLLLLYTPWCTTTTHTQAYRELVFKRRSHRIIMEASLRPVCSTSSYIPLVFRYRDFTMLYTLICICV